MKILAVSDQVVDNVYNARVRDRFGDVELIISCGDLPYYYLEFLVSALDAPLYYVNGNHDRSYEYTATGTRNISAQGCELLDSRVAYVCGLWLAGLEGSVRYNNEGEFQFSQSEMSRKALWMSWRLMLNQLRGRKLDILVTHSPPFGVGDGPDAAHIGFHAINRLLRWFKPHYLLHGHQHTYRGQKPGTQVGATKVINVFPYRVIEWERAIVE